MNPKKKPKSLKSGVIPVSLSLHKEVSDVPARDDKAAPVTRRVLYLSLQAIGNAIVIGIVAKALVAVIDLITNLAFYGRFSFADADPSNRLGLLVIIIPVIGGLIVGIMARYGNAGIRGHGIPEAMEQVLVNESRISPIITFLKPLSAAIAIGTGGPFGAEGPIIATGGALGSVTGQIMRITASERKIMLTAGACAGMSAIFGSPVAGVLLAIELLLFEFSPRSIIPVALSCATGAATHIALFGTRPMFAMADIPSPTPAALAVYVFFGVLIGVLAAFVSKSVYLIEDLFDRLPLHWMWWPALGAIVVGVIGYFYPVTMGVGYDNIRHLLSGTLPITLLLVLGFLKFISWSVALGSGTSGGTLAPLFTIGGALGGLIGLWTLSLFPHCGINLPTAVLIGMAAMFAGASRALLTSIVFAVETTQQPHGLLPLLGACTAAYFVSFFLMKGTIMTEKIERRGVITPHSLQPDILEKVQVKEVMDPQAKVISADSTIRESRRLILEYEGEMAAGQFIVVDIKGNLLGMVSRREIFDMAAEPSDPLARLITQAPPRIYTDNTLNQAVDLMGVAGLDILPVVNRENPHELIGTITPQNIFRAFALRSKEDELSRHSVSLRRKGLKMFARGKHLFQREK
ncbi:MAG TPA: chloride channel protein [Chitinophagaceae bacterium]|nr:chloride channel protein [Chitinophagaceae bacterium]